MPPYGGLPVDEDPTNAAALPMPSGAGTTLPVAGQPDLARETARGASMSGNTGLADAAPGFFARLQAGDPKTLKGVAVALMALSDAADRLSTGKTSTKAVDFMTRLEQMDLAQSAETRAKAADVRAERRDVREEELLQRGGQREAREARAQFLSELLTVAPRLFAASDEDRLKAVGALEQRASEFGLQPLVRGLTGDINVAKLAGQYAPLLQKYGSEGLGLAVNQLYAKGDSAGALKFVEDHMKPFAMVEARDAVRNIITNLSDGEKRPAYAEVLGAIKAQSPLYARIIEQNPDFYSGEFALRGITTPKVAEIGAEARAKEMSLEQARARAKAAAIGTAEAATSPEARAAAGAKTAEKVAEQRALLPGKEEETRRLEQIKADIKAAGGATPEQTQKMREDFEKGSQMFIAERGAVGKLRRAVVAGQDEKNTAGRRNAADISLIYNFITLLDARSTVREGEEALVEQVHGVPEQTRRLYNKLVGGGILTTGQRAGYLEEAESLFEEKLRYHLQREGEYRRIAREAKIPESQVIVDLVSPEDRKRLAGKSGDLSMLPDAEIKKRLGIK